MLESSSSSTPEAEPRVKSLSRWLFLGLPIWVLVSFYAAQVVFMGVMYGLNALNVPVGDLSDTVFNTLVAAAVYVLSLIHI